MHRLLMIASALVLAVLALPAQGEADKADDKGWVQIFNGKDLTGWMLPDNTNPKEIVQVIAKRDAAGKLLAYSGKMKDGKIEPLWHVENGMIVGEGPHSHLLTERDDYENFHFRAEAMINDQGNSGMFFRTAAGPNFPEGYEAQINATHKDPIRTGSLYPKGSLGKYKDKITVMNTAPHKPDEWFTQEVIADGNHIIILVNGKVTVDFKDPENRYKKGRFGLQGHNLGTVVKFRKIEVKELPATK